MAADTLPDMGERDAALQAWGESFALMPEIQELVALRKEMGSGATKEAARAAILRRAKELELTTERLFFRRLPDELLDLDFQMFAQQLDLGLARLGPLTLRRLSDYLSLQVGYDDWLVSYVEEYARTGKPRAFFDGLKGAVGKVRLPGTEATAAVYAVATAASPLETTIQEFRDRCVAEFGGVPRMKPETQEAAARFFRLFQEGSTNRQIAEMELEEFRLRAASEDEYKQELRLMTARVRQLRRRYREYVTKVGKHMSRDSEG